jgi:hypothetical protein
VEKGWRCRGGCVDDPSRILTVYGFCGAVLEKLLNCFGERIRGDGVNAITSLLSDLRKKFGVICFVTEN